MKFISRGLSCRVAYWAVGLTLMGSLYGAAWAKTAQEINSSVDACLTRFYREVNGGREAAARAKGVLVMPDVLKAGFIVGGEYGQGALRVGGKTDSYYNLASGSVGLQIGGEDRDIVILFMTDEALQKFKAGKGWEAGVDADVAVVTAGAGKTADLAKMNDPIVAYVFDVKGLMADISLKGAKFTKISPA